MRTLFFGLISFFLTVSSINASEGQDIIHLNLQQAISLATKQNAQVLAANQRVLQSVANISVNRASLLPQITGTLGGKRQTVDMRASGIQLPGDPHIGPFNSFDTRGRLTMEIFDPEAIARLHSAKAGEKLSQAQLLKIRQDVLALVGAMFLEAQRAQQAIDLTAVFLEQAKLQNQILATRFKQGTGSQTDFDKSKVLLAQAQYTYQATLVHAEETRLDLASALKISLDKSIVFDEDKTWINKELQQGQETPDVVLAQAQLEQSKAMQRQTKSSLWPKIVASGDLGQSGKSPDASSRTYSLGIAMSVPIWEGGAQQAQVQQAKAKVKEDDILLADAKDQSDLKIREAQNSLTQAKAFLKAKDEQLKYFKQQGIILQNRLQSGLADSLEALSFESSQAMALDEKNEAQALYWTAKINLAHAYGKVEDLFGISTEGGPAFGGNLSR